MGAQRERECMEFSVKLFRVVGCWPIWRQKNRRSEQVYFCYTAAIFAVLFIYVSILAYGMCVHYSEWTTMEEALEEMIVFATGFIVLLKVILILGNQTKLESIINYLNKDLNKRQLMDQEDASVIRSCVKHEKFITKSYVFGGYCITILYTASSIIRILKERAIEGNYTLPLKYPFQPNRFPWYHTAYLHQMIVMILNGHIGTLTDSFFSCLTYYVCGHFEIIEKRIEKENGVITRNFVSYHNEMIRLVGVLQKIFGSFMLFQLLSTTILICSGLLQVTQVKNINLLHYLKCVIYVTIKLSQLFLYCWYGQRLMNMSLSVSMGAYFGRWHELGFKSKNVNLQIVMHRAQKPVMIKAGTYFYLSLPTLAKVINSAYSFFTMIKSTQKD